MSYIWHADPTQFNIGWLKETLKLQLSDWFKQAWSSLVQNTPSATNYKIFKTSFGFEQYLNLASSKENTFMKHLYHISMRCLLKLAHLNAGFTETRKKFF